MKPENGHAASRRSNVASFIAMDVLREANRLEQAGRRILHLEVGQPGTQAPFAVREAAARALETEKLGYTDALGIDALRQRIARQYGDAHDLDIDPRRIAVTTGSSGAFILSYLAAFDPGARIGLPVPGYPANRNIVQALGLIDVPLRLTAQSRWAPTPDQVLAARRNGGLDGLLIASPANPSGTMVKPEALGALCGLADAEGLRFISDEIYHGLTYDLPAETALKFTDRAIIINSFSKFYSMTGWRVGWVVVPEDLLRPFERLAQNLFISVPALSQMAAIAAFDAGEELEANRTVYARNRELLARRLPEIGLGDFLPMDGAFYAYADVSRYCEDSAELADRLLHEAGVAVTPGADFDPEEGHRYIRLSYAGPHEEIDEAVSLIGEWLKERQGAAD